MAVERYQHTFTLPGINNKFVTEKQQLPYIIIIDKTDLFEP
jgi:hypothetical protein